MESAGIVLDSWKLPIFEKMLNDNNYKYTQHPGITKDAITLKVEFEDIKKLQPLIAKANQDAAKSKLN